MGKIPSYMDYDATPNDWFVKTKRADGSDPYKNERDLFSLWITEAINLHGVTMTYYVVNFNLSADRLQGEDPSRKIERSFDFMAFYNLDSAKEDKIWSRFGIEGMDQIVCTCSKKHFNVASQYDISKVDPVQSPAVIPKTGDLVKSKFNSYMYEVEDVKEELGLYMQSKQHIWSLYLKPWRNENLDVSASTSADMTDLTTLIATQDSFSVKDVVLSAAPVVVYNPPATEKASDEFWN